MLIRRALIVILTLTVALGSAAVAAQRPDHGSGRPTPRDRGTPAGAFDCSGVETYAEDLNDLLRARGPFLDFVFSDQEFGDLSRREAEEIIADGDVLIAELGEVEVPAPYQPGHDGLILFFQNMVDFPRFYALDTSRVPDILARDEAMTGIYQGEVAIAEACPGEIEELGGHIFIDPTTLEDEYGGE